MDDRQKTASMPVKTFVKRLLGIHSPSKSQFYDLEKLKNLHHDKRVKNAEQLSELITFANTFDDRLVFVKDIIGFYLDMANRCGIPPKDIRFSIFDILSNLGSVPTANIKICAEMGAKKGETE